MCKTAETSIYRVWMRSYTSNFRITHLVNRKQRIERKMSVHQTLSTLSKRKRKWMILCLVHVIGVGSPSEMKLVKHIARRACALHSQDSQDVDVIWEFTALGLLLIQAVGLGGGKKLHPTLTKCFFYKVVDIVVKYTMYTRKWGSEK